ncbi:Ax21 family protein [Marilutibacter aestuarii]|uniref:Ax21 family protein n=1 Tax=Marilutibacter aestuarii TaxID=1706195 RepID=A0A508AC44_9GAMM|nr:Ax21 family protein [Lysobacter aestuarii]TQD46977.1 Ax21 family protein [Lysobacter aestuarii]
MKRSTLSKLAALSLIAAVPFAASAAEGVSYNYVQGGYIATDTDNGDADGWAIEGSGAIAPNFHVFGKYSNQEFENSNFDFDQWKLGVGYNHEINRSVDLLTRVAYEKFDAGYGFDYDGWSVEAGVRGAFSPHFEGYALAGYEDYEASDGDFYGRVGANAKFNQNWSINGDVKFADGDTEWFVGPRYTF